MAVEFFGQGVPEELAADGLLRDVLRLDDGGFRKTFVDVGGVLQEGTGHNHGGVEVALVTEDVLAEIAVIHHADGGKDHHDAEGHQAKAGDGSFEIGTQHLREALVNVAEPAVKGVVLGIGEFVFHVAEFDEYLVEVVETLAKFLEVGVGSVRSTAQEDVFPFIVTNEVVEQERLNRPFSASGMRLLICLGVPERTQLTQGWSTQTNSRSLRRT